MRHLFLEYDTVRITVVVLQASNIRNQNNDFRG